MGTLKFFWNSEENDFHAKYLIYMVVHFIYFCGDKLDKLVLSHSRCTRSILEIKWSEFIDGRISNNFIWKTFCSISNVEIQIAKTILYHVPRIHSQKNFDRYKPVKLY